MLAQPDPSSLLVCGTNSFNPKCRTYSTKKVATGDDSTTLDEDSNEEAFFKAKHEYSGKGFCPYDPRHNSTAIFTGKSTAIYFPSWGWNLNLLEQG